MEHLEQDTDGRHGSDTFYTRECICNQLDCRMFPVADNGETSFFQFVPDWPSSLFWFYSSLEVSGGTFTSQSFSVLRGSKLNSSKLLVMMTRFNSSQLFKYSLGFMLCSLQLRMFAFPTSYIEKCNRAHLKLDFKLGKLYENYNFERQELGRCAVNTKHSLLS